MYVLQIAIGNEHLILAQIILYSESWKCMFDHLNMMILIMTYACNNRKYTLYEIYVRTCTCENIWRNVDKL